MKLCRVLLALALVAGLAGVAYVRQASEPAGTKMVAAAEQFLASLTKEQKAKAVVPFDDKERFNWHFVPLQDANRKATRKGLPLEEMNAEQRNAAQALLQAGTSADGYKAATTIMSLEAILRELEKGGRSVRDPDWYFFTIFGTPAKTGRWGWRVEGHHLSLNFVVDNGQLLASSPAFFGANPAIVMGGPRKGQQTLADAVNLVRELVKTLDESQKKVAHQSQQFPEIRAQNKAPELGEPVGLAGAKMTESQRAQLMKLLQAYANRMPPEVADTEMRQVKEAGIDKVHFAYAGGIEPGQPLTYRIQGPTFRVEFLNVQADSAKNPANHIHSVWRSTKGDFGLTTN
jgi:hypothetical protein